MENLSPKERLITISIVCLCAFGSISWVGGQTLYNALDKLDRMVEFRAVQIEKNKAYDQMIVDAAITKEVVIRIEERLQQWEPVSQ